MMKIENPKDEYEMSECREILTNRFPQVGNTLKFVGEDNREHVGKVLFVDLEYENNEVDFVAGLVALEFPNKMIESFMLTVQDEWYGKEHDEYGMDLYLYNRYDNIFAYEIVQ